MNIRQKSQGLSIIEVLVAAAIMGGLAFAFIQFLGGAAKGQKNVQNAVDFDILKTSINLILNTKACDGAIRDNAGLPVTFVFTSPLPTSGNALSGPVAIGKMVQGSATILDMTKPDLGGGLKLSKLEITSAVGDGTQSISGVAYNAYVSVLNVTVTKQAGSLGAPEYSKDFSVRLLVNATNNRAEKCTTTGVVKKGREDCPTGYSLVGTSGDLSAFCISTQRRPASLVAPAEAYCDSQNPKARFCNTEEWSMACRTAASAVPPITEIMAGTGAAKEFINPAGHGGYGRTQNIVGNDCSAGATSCIAPPTTCNSYKEGHNVDYFGIQAAYRCCLH